MDEATRKVLVDAMDRTIARSVRPKEQTYEDGYEDGVAAERHAQELMPRTRTDPSRAEMAMAIYPQCLAYYHRAMENGEVGAVAGWKDSVAESAVEHADALIAALARKEKP